MLLAEMVRSLEKQPTKEAQSIILFIAIASKLGKRKTNPPTHQPKSYKAIKNRFEKFPRRDGIECCYKWLLYSEF